VADSQGTVYAITLSGLSVIPLTPAGAATRPAIAAGTRGVVNSADGTNNIKPGSFITVNGTNLAAPATATTIPVPTVLGGSCVTFGDIAVPLLQTSAGQIQAQVPETLRPGTQVVQVRSLATAQASDPVQVTVRSASGSPGSPDPGTGSGSSAGGTSGDNGASGDPPADPGPPAGDDGGDGAGTPPQG